MLAIDRSLRVHIDVRRLGAEGAELGTLVTTYGDLDATGNKGAEEIPLDDNPDFRLPSGVAYAIWANINGGQYDGRVTTMSGNWHSYDWRLASAS